MMYTIALLATVVTSMSTYHPLMSETGLVKEFRPVSNEPFEQNAQVSNNDWFNQIPLKGKGPNGCDFSDIDIASVYHLKLVEAHPMYIACQLESAKTNAIEQFPRNMKRDMEVGEVASPREEDLLDEESESVNTDDTVLQQYLERNPDYLEKEKANKEATLTKVAELTKEVETLKASLPAVSNGKIENLESLESIKRSFTQILLKSRPLDIRYDQVLDLNKNIEEFSQTIKDYNDMANDMCISGRASYCVHFNQRRFHNELVTVQKKYIVLENEILKNEKETTEELLQSYKNRLNALKSRYTVLFGVELNQWRSFRIYYITVLGEISKIESEIDQRLSLSI
ncbi:hypothetical protein OXX79_009326 [Metschnikowia pulcherrima]